MFDTPFVSIVCHGRQHNVFWQIIYIVKILVAIKDKIEITTPTISAQVTIRITSFLYCEI